MLIKTNEINRDNELTWCKIALLAIKVFSAFILKREEITNKTSSSFLIINLRINFREEIKKNFAELNYINEINEIKIS